MSRSNPIVADVIARDLARYGARRCFALLGTANFKISHALVQAGVDLISARHECNAASMADAYAKASGELTLVSVHSGPGLTKRTDRDRRSSQKPDAACGTGRRRAERCGKE